MKKRLEFQTQLSGTRCVIRQSLIALILISSKSVVVRLVELLPPNRIVLPPPPARLLLLLLTPTPPPPPLPGTAIIRPAAVRIVPGPFGRPPPNVAVVASALEMTWGVGDAVDVVVDDDVTEPIGDVSV